MSETENDTQKKSTHSFAAGSLGAVLNEKEKKSLLTYIALGIIIVECVVTVVAILHGVTNLQPNPDGGMEYLFPWKAYLVAVLLAPIAVMFIIQIIGMGFNRFINGDPVMEHVDNEHIPEKMRSWIHLINGMPTTILLAGFLFVGMLLYNMDIIIGFILKLGEVAAELAIWISVGLVSAWIISYVCKMYFMYRTRRVSEEYAFRREVLEKTGIAIIDQKTAITPDGRMLIADSSSKGNGPIDIDPETAIEGGTVIEPKSLPPSQSDKLL
ncbi:hypothetical protein [Halodesulfovibrio sp.]|jgi:hypothetical protein|uniref:hypothetical protein n=1 Tax=Halodesulfovibrio sp. TaxID=1912772 RepID=UPI0025F5A361|nr:hypothetical protein [Halodesulfovibrio sp.]MCT4533901.1 hypothetical protein [Halodesulfovibrio sp.]MCT4628133.1 hypothetical protein [Halodesulfovibrio sp.]